MGSDKLSENPLSGLMRFRLTGILLYYNMYKAVHLLVLLGMIRICEVGGQSGFKLKIFQVTILHVFPSFNNNL